MQPVEDILSSLPATTLRHLDKYILSPYHVTHQGVRDLYALLREKTNINGQVDRGLMAKQIGVSSRRIGHIYSYLLEVLERFLAQEKWDENKMDGFILTVEQLRLLKNNDASAAMLRYARKHLEQHPLRGGEYHRNRYRLFLEEYHLSLQQGRARDYGLQELSDAQDLAFICEKLRTGCMLLSHEVVRQQPYEKGLLAPVLDFLTGHPYLSEPAVAVYYHGYFAQMGGEGSDAHFRQLKSLLEEHTEKLSPPELHDLYLMAINFCIRRINRSEESYYRDVFELYRSGLSAGALLEGGILSRWTYNNVAMVALMLREFDWAWQFLHESAPLLAEDHREAAFHFNLARYYYDTQEYHSAMKHLLFMEYDDVLQNLVAKVMLCKIYYALDELEALESQLDNIQIYLRRKKVLGYHKDNYLAFVRLMRRLLGVRFLGQKARDAFRAEVESVGGLTEKDWLLRQVG